jgi:hypothetical protein
LIGIDRFIIRFWVFFAGVKWLGGVVLTGHPLLAPRLSMGTAVVLPLLRACFEFYGTAFMSVVDLSVLKDILP